MMAVMKAIANTLSRNIAILALPGVSALDLTGPHEVFSLGVPWEFPGSSGDSI